MYNAVKKLFPKKFLIKNEQVFRSAIMAFYLGDRHKCTICEKTFRKFLLNQRGEKLCPNCGSLPRDRRLYQLFEERFSGISGFRLLDFSPSRSLYRKFKSMPGVAYYPTDMSDDFIAEYHYDITRIPADEGFFDAILCYHILEHIDDDRLAMQELYRVLKNGGTAFVQTPYREGAIFENPEYTTKQERLRHFGQEDHVRIYSADGLMKRLQSVGFKVTMRTFREEDYHGLAGDEKVLVLTKNSDSIGAPDGLL